MGADKKVKLEVVTDVEADEVEALERRLRKLKLQKIRQTLEIDSSELNRVTSEIEALKEKLKSKSTFNLDDEDVKKVEAEIADLKQQQIALEIAVNTDKLEEAKAKVDDLDNTTIDIDLNQAMQNIGVGVTQVNNSISEIVNGLGEIQEAGAQVEQNKAFLTMNLGAEKANKTFQDIQNTVAKMPGDDNTMTSILSTAAALGTEFKDGEMESIVGTMADYMAGSATQGKMALETQQDLQKYLLDGNTAELERGSIVSRYVDKLKEGTTIQERAALLDEALADLKYKGIANQDTLLNKQAEWDGMIYKSKANLSDMWLKAEQGVMDYIIKQDEASGGVLGMGIAIGQVAAGPLAELVSGLGEVGLGVKTLKDFSSWAGLSDKIGNIKTKLLDVGSAAKTSLLKLKDFAGVKFAALKTELIAVAKKAKEAALALLEAGKNALIGGYNALKSAAMWAVDKATKVASTIATWAMAAAEWALNSALLSNPLTWIIILLVALAAAFIWAYNNVDWFREGVDNACAAIVSGFQWLWGIISGWTSDFGSNVGSWIQSLLQFIIFLPTLPLQLGIMFANAIAKLLGFKGNFVSNLISSAWEAVKGFLIKIGLLSPQFASELERMLSLVQEWAATLPQKFWEAGVNAVKNFLNALGIHSPGFMFYAVQGEIDRMDDLTKSAEIDTSRLGENMVSGFNPNFDTSNNEISSLSNNSITINIENVDNEERIKQIVEAVEQALNFDNETAGRVI